MSIEKNIGALESLLSELENEDVELDKAVTKYAEALKLATKTQLALNKLEQKVFLLQKEVVPQDVDALKAPF